MIIKTDFHIRMLAALRGMAMSFYELHGVQRNTSFESCCRIVAMDSEINQLFGCLDSELL